MSIILIFPLVFLISAVCTGIVLRFARSASLVDTPVFRSAHSIPVPTSGGLSIVLVMLLVTLIGYLQGEIPRPEFMALMGAVAIAGIGLVDDVAALDIKWRMPVQVVAAAWSIWWLGGSPTLLIGPWLIDLPWIMGLALVVALVWLLNLYNFMDGIDGLAGSQACFVSLATLLIVADTDDRVVQLLAVTLLAANAGFLLWNWAPARIFMGDVGSGFLGFSFGIMALLAIHHGSMNFWTWLLLLGVFVVDSTVTLVQRFVAGEKWYEGHSSHAYQKAARTFNSHSRVTITTILVNIIWLGPLAWLTVRQPGYAAVIALIGLAPLLWITLQLGAGKNSR